MYNYLKPPVFPDDEEKTQTARALHIMLWLVVGATTLLLVAVIIFPPFYQPWRIILNAGFNYIVSLVAFTLNKRGRPRLAALLLCLFLFIATVLSALTAGGLQAPASLVFFLFIFSVGLLLGARSGVVSAMLCIATALGLTMLKSWNLLPEPLVRHTPYSYWAIFSVAIVVMAGLQYLADVTIKDAVKASKKELAERKQIEDKLRKSEEKYRTILENIEDGYYEADLNGNFTFFNDSMCRILGYSQEEMMGMNNRQFTDKVNAKKLFQAFNKVYKTGESDKEFDCQIIRKDGNNAYIEVSVSLQRNSSGKPIGFQGIARDITERKQVEKALCESENKYKNLIENIPDIIFTIDLEGKITFVSKRAKEILGYENEETINRNIFDFIPAEAHESTMEKLRKGMEGEKIKHVQLPVTAKSGKELFFDFSFSRIYEDGVVVGAQGTAVDVTERIRAETALRESEERYRWVLNNMADLITIMDLNLRFIYVSPAILRMRGYTAEEAVAQTFEQVMTPESLQISAKVFEEEMRLEASGTADPDRIRIINVEQYRKDGSIVLMENHLSFMRNEAKKPVGIISVSRDITERKQAEEALKKSELKYRNIFENAVEGIYQSTLEGRFITANAALARMAGYDSPEEFIESIKDIGTQLYVNPEDRKRFMQIKNEKGFVDGFEVEFYKKDGSTFWVVINAQTVKDEQGKILYNEGLIEDITIRKHTEEQLQQTLESLRKAVGTTIQVLVSAVESRDPYTSGHQSRSADLACIIAREMGLAQDKIEGIRMAGIIHDIGKLSVPVAILSKPSKLTAIEFSLIKEHARSGYEMLKNVESPWPLAEIVYQHHERMNGSGYPRNLKGGEILMESQILAVADVVEAMASHRPYRAALGIEAALEEIEKNKGILYDYVVADACLRLFREKGFHLT
jgi:PAS domain S-box-containing protein